MLKKPSRPESRTKTVPAWSMVRQRKADKNTNTNSPKPPACRSRRLFVRETQGKRGDLTAALLVSGAFPQTASAPPGNFYRGSNEPRGPGWSGRSSPSGRHPFGLPAVNSTLPCLSGGRSLPALLFLWPRTPRRPYGAPPFTASCFPLRPHKILALKKISEFSNKILRRCV